MTEETIDRDQLITVALKYGTYAKPLKVVAFAQLTAKALCLSKRPLSVTELQKEVASILSVKSVDEHFVKEALAYLVDIGKTKEVLQGWILQSEERKEIHQATQKSQDALLELLKRHFPVEKIERRKLKAWFNEAINSFFASLGDSWIISISRGAKSPPRQPAMVEVLKKTAEKHDLKEYELELINGFDQFLRSGNLSDQKYILYVSQAMFAARLVAADVGADPLSLNELKDAILILDTNVIFAIMLEAHRLAPSLGKLEKAFRSIGIQLRYLRSSAEEYERALAGKRQEVLSLASLFRPDVLCEVKDDFISTAKVRRCQTSEDYERFFNSLNNLPDSLEDGYEIKLLEDDVIAKQIDEASKDDNLKRTIQKFAEKMRKRGPKSAVSLCHDASLIKVTEALRAENEKCWILSLDRSLLAADAHRAAPTALPNALSIAALIEILAINNAGPELSANDMAPLFASMIANECTPHEESKMAYTLGDLKILHTINEAAADLPSEDIQAIARQIAKDRAEGKNASNVDFQLKINRLCQSYRENLDERLKTARQNEQNALNQAGLALGQRKQLEDEIASLRTKQKKDEDIRNALLVIVFSVFLAVVVGLVVWKYGRSLYCNIFNCEDLGVIVHDILDYGWNAVWFFLWPIWINAKKIWNLSRSR